MGFFWCELKVVRNLAGQKKGALIPEQSLPGFPAAVACQFLHTVRGLYFTTFVIDAYFRRDSNSAAISSAF
jgi:hypothetical protein